MKNTVTTYSARIGSGFNKVFYSEEELNKAVEEETQRLINQGFQSLVEDIKPKKHVNGFATYLLGSDREPYEIVKVVSDKTIEVRLMDAELINGDDLKFHIGGFAAHCSNQHTQKYKYTSNENNEVVRIRLCKDGYWKFKSRKFQLTEKPHKFYDYNF